jgi:hypothetical protein
MLRRKLALAPRRGHQQKSLKRRTYQPRFEILEDRLVPTTAYLVPAGTVGNQAFNGAVGMDFDVNPNQPIEVSELGVFDSGSDGLQTTITVKLYNRDTGQVVTQGAEVAQLTFAAGNTGELIGGSRFLALSTPLFLPAGFHGSIVAEGYGNGEELGNALIAGTWSPGPFPWTTADGGGEINFVGSGRFGSAGDYPTNPGGGPVNCFAAGTFMFGSGAPFALDDSYSLAFGTTLTVSAGQGVLSNDTFFAPGAGHAVLLSSQTGAKGTLALGSDGSFTYTPFAGQFGTDTFTYQAVDSLGDTSNPATITFTIADPSPIAGNDSYSVGYNGSLTVATPGVLGNDVDPAGHPMTAVLSANPLKGTVTLNADGSFTYTPNQGEFGPDFFTYHDHDSAGHDSADATVTITIGDPPPFVHNDFYTTTFNTQLTVPAVTGVLANDFDAGGHAMTAVLDTNPTKGTLSFSSDGSFIYTPNAGQFGADTFTYHDVDSIGGVSTEGTVTITIGEPPPRALDDSYNVLFNTPLTVPPNGVLNNDTDPAGHAMTAVQLSNPSKGTVVLNADGSFTYTPNHNAFGPDAFTYQVVDTAGNTSNVATVHLMIGQPPPVANDDFYNVTFNTQLTVPAPGVMVNDVDPEGLPMAATLVSGPSKGTLTFNANGSFTYTPNHNAFGADSFQYAVTDTAGGTSNVATVHLTISQPPPVANDDSYNVTFNTPLTIAAPGVLLNDVDPEGLPLAASMVSGPTKGTLLFHPDGSFTYTPTTNAVGTDSFTYFDTDTAGGTSNIATVHLTISQPTLQPPIARDDFYTAHVGEPLNVGQTTGVLANDSDPQGLAMTAALISGPKKGSLTFHSDGSFTYTAHANGTDTFSYQVTDSAGLKSNIATVTINNGKFSTCITTPCVKNTIFGETLTIQVRVSSEGGTPTGDVQFTFTGPHPIAAHVVHLVNGVATLTLKDVPAGANYVVRAQYLGNADFLPSKVSHATFTITKDTSRVTDVRAVVDEDDVTLSAHVVTTHGGPATGQVAFTVKGPNGTHTYFATVNKQGVASIKVNELPRGTYTITGVQYLGDANVLASPILHANVVFVIKHGRQGHHSHHGHHDHHH